MSEAELESVIASTLSAPVETPEKSYSDKSNLDKFNKESPRPVYWREIVIAPGLKIMADQDWSAADYSTLEHKIRAAIEALNQTAHGCKRRIEMTIALPLLNETEKATKRRGVGCIEVTQKEKRIKLPLSSVQLRARVADRLAHVTVTETFQNPFSEHLEAVYIFPLSGGCAVASFQMKVGDRLIDGQVQERQQARAQYEQAMQEGKRAALMEQERDDVFTVQVGNLPPGEEITVILTYSEKLPYFDQGQTEIRLPLVVAPRYIPGTALERESVGDGVELDTDIVPDASRITPPRLVSGVNAKVDLDLSVELAAVEAIEDLSCSQHATRMGAGKEGVTISLARVDELLDRDFVLRWRVATDTVQSKFLIYQSTIGGATPADSKAGATKKDESKKSDSKKVVAKVDAARVEAAKSDEAADYQDQGDYYGMISLVPPAGDEIVRPARDVIFVVDRSGSMQGIKMVSAARACSILLATLGPSDRFAIQAFENSSHWMIDAGGGYFFDADEAGLDKGFKFLRDIVASGGTEMYGALDRAISVMDKNRTGSQRMPVIVLLTDGEIGNESSIFKLTQEGLGENRIFTVGIDTAVNDGFLRKLAIIGGGTSTFVEPGTELEQALSHVGREIGCPLITDLVIEDINCGLDKDSIAPNTLPDLFEGRAINAFFKMSLAKVKDLSAAKLRLRGKYADLKKFTAEVSATTTDVKSLPQLWAKSTVVDLEDKYRLASGNAQDKLKNQIVAIAVQHSLLTRFTAFVVVDHAEIVNKDGISRKVVQPVEMPASWALPADAGGYGAAPAASWGGVAGSWGSGMASIGGLPAPMPAPHIPPPPAGVPASPRVNSIGRFNLSDEDLKQLRSIGQSADVESFEGCQPSVGSGWSDSAQQQAPQAQEDSSNWFCEPMQPTPPPQQNTRKKLFKALGDEAIDKLFEQNLGLNDQSMQKMRSQPAKPPAPPSRPLSAPGQSSNFPVGHPSIPWPLSGHSGGSGGGGQGSGAGSEKDLEALQLSFSDFEDAIKEIFESIAAGKLIAVDKLDRTRSALLKTLSQSSLAQRLPQLQKYLRAEVLHLLSALASAKAVSEKLKVLAEDHREKFEEIAEEVSGQMQEENRPFWGLTV